ncbi:MAG: hypothetical protein DWQ05_23140 [Calditrichaeota bacterium]|nr:MAG: hypothetical protein DWQ05_23140 [Calditrichota bacterium]
MNNSSPKSKRPSSTIGATRNGQAGPYGESILPPKTGIDWLDGGTIDTIKVNQPTDDKILAGIQNPKQSEVTPLETSAVEKAPTNPKEDPSFQKVVGQVKFKAKKDKIPPKSPEEKSSDTKLAAELPAEKIKDQRVSEQHLQELETIKTEYTVDEFMGEFKKSTEEVAKVLPDTKKEHNRFATIIGFRKEKDNAGKKLTKQSKSFSDPLKEKLDKKTSDVQANIQSSEIELKVDPAGKKQIIKHTAPAAPKPKTDSEISLDDKSKSLDDVLSGHKVSGQEINVDDEMLSFDVSGEKEFDEAGQAKRKAQDEIQKARPKYRAAEKQEIDNAHNEIKSVVGSGLGKFNNSRRSRFGKVFNEQKLREGNIEKKKSESHVKLQKIYLDAKNNVEIELNKLTEVEAEFETVLNNAEKYFRDWVHQDLEYIYTPGFFDYSNWIDVRRGAVDKEYKKLLAKKYKKIDAEIEQLSKESKALGWMAKEFSGVSRFGGDMYLYADAVKIVQDRDSLALFKKAKNRFINDVTEGARIIAVKVVNVLNAAKGIIKTGLNNLETEYKGLSAAEQSEVEAVFGGIKTQFELLGDSVEDRKREIIREMAQSYNKGVGKLQTTFDTIKKDVLTSWFEKAWNKIKAVVNAILNFAKRIAELLGRLAHLVGDIISSPRYFFNNLVDGIGQGFDTFASKIDEYLATAFFDWLRGKSGMMIQLPKDWSPKSIFSLFTQLLGLTTETIWQRMEVVYNKKIANVFRKGESFVEKGLEVFSIVKKDGIGGLWQYIKESLGNILDETLKMLKENILYAAIKKVIFEIAKLLVPGGGFIAIAEKVVRFLQFIVEARDKILDLIEAFVDSVEMAVNGNIPGIVKHLTGALTRFVTVALDFLVTFFGLRSLKEKVERIIQKMRKPIIRGIDWVLGKIKPLVYKVFRGITKGKEKVQEIKSKFVSWWQARKKFIDEKGEKHTLRFEGEGKRAYLVINPNPELLQDKIQYLEENYATAAAASQIRIIKKHAKAIDKLKTKKDKETGKDVKTSAMSQKTGKEIHRHFDSIASALGHKAFKGTESVPESKIRFPEQKQILGDTVGKKMVAAPLSIDSGGHSGSQPQSSAESNLWKKVNQRKNSYVQGHLLNHNLHGSGAIKENLVPITRTLNNPEMLKYETDVKNAILKKNKIISYRVEAKFESHSGSRSFKYLPEEEFLPSSIQLTAKYMKIKSKTADRKVPGNWIEGKDLFPAKKLVHKLPEDNPLDKQQKQLYQLNINGKTNDTKNGLQTIPYIGEVIAQRIINGGVYSKFDDLKRITGVDENIIKHLRDEKNPEGKRLVYTSGKTVWR